MVSDCKVVLSFGLYPFFGVGYGVFLGSRILCVGWYIYSVFATFVLPEFTHFLANSGQERF